MHAISVPHDILPCAKALGSHLIEAISMTLVLATGIWEFRK